ncbi:MAG TPA: hypothetical protein VKW06_08845 [Candidatus Angelobacter sp.]|nr:hypothetical protein [Candidatus Angelobacter sp.]
MAFDLAAGLDIDDESQAQKPSYEELLRQLSGGSAVGGGGVLIDQALRASAGSSSKAASATNARQIHGDMEPLDSPQPDESRTDSRPTATSGSIENHLTGDRFLTHNGEDWRYGGKSGSIQTDDGKRLAPADVHQGAADLGEALNQAFRSRARTLTTPHGDFVNRGRFNADDQGTSTASASSPAPYGDASTGSNPFMRAGSPERIAALSKTLGSVPAESSDEAALQAHLRERLAQNIDPTDRKYRMGFGGRLAGALTNFASGMAGRGPAVYIGPGATNRQFTKDTGARQRDIDRTQAQIASHDEELKHARQTFTDRRNEELSTVREANADERERHNRQMETLRGQYQKDFDDLKKQAQDAKDQVRDIRYDKMTGHYMRGGKVYAPKGVEEGVVLETANGVKNGPYTKLWMTERRNQPINLRTGPKLSARDQMRVNTYAREHDVDPGDLTFDQLNEALGGGKKKAAQTFKDSAAVDKYSDQWYRQRESQLHSTERAIKKKYGDPGDLDRDDKARIQGELDAAYNGYRSDTEAFEGRKKGYYSAVGAGKSVSIDEQGQILQDPNTVRVQKPDGTTGTIPRANKSKLPRGWKVIGE